MQQSPVILGLCFRKTWAGKSRDYCDVVIFKNLHFQIVSCLLWNAKLVFSNSSSLKSVFKKFCFCDGLVWTVGLTMERKLHFQISPVQGG